MGQVDSPVELQAVLNRVSATSPTPSPTCAPDELRALVTMYNAMGGPSWRFQRGWARAAQAASQTPTPTLGSHNPRRHRDHSADGAFATPTASPSATRPSVLAVPSLEGDPCIVPWDGVVCERGHVIAVYVAGCRSLLSPWRLGAGDVQWCLHVMCVFDVGWR